MSFETFWSNACTFARDKPTQTQIDAAHASGSVTVRHDAAAATANCRCHVFALLRMPLCNVTRCRLLPTAPAHLQGVSHCFVGGGWPIGGGGAVARVATVWAVQWAHVLQTAAAASVPCHGGRG